MSLGPIPSQPLPAAPISHSKKKQAPLTTAPATTHQPAISLAQKTPTPPSTRSTIQNIAVQKTTDTHDGMTKWISKVTALAMESVPAIALVNYRFFQQTQLGNASAYKPTISDYFRGGHIAAPARLACYSLALGASDLGSHLSKSVWPNISQENQYLVGGFSSALVGGLLSVPVEGVMVKCMDAVKNKVEFNIMEALLQKPSSSAILITWAREMPYFLGLSVGPKLIQPLLPNWIPDTQKKNTALILTATSVSLLTQPMDTIKTKVQQNTWTIPKATTEIAKSGIKNFFVGSTPRLAKVYMNFFTTWVIADKLYQLATDYQAKK
jgi:hypothetical protein